MEVSIKWNVCRVCLQEESQNGTSTTGSSKSLNPMRHIFKDRKLAKQIFDCSGVVMKPNDSLPEKICIQCLAALKHAIHFRTSCRNSDEHLQSVVQKTRSASSRFKRDKRREKSLELVDEEMNNIFLDDENDIDDNDGNSVHDDEGNDVDDEGNDVDDDDDRNDVDEVNNSKDIPSEKRKRERTSTRNEQSTGIKKYKATAKATNIVSDARNSEEIILDRSDSVSKHDGAKISFDGLQNMKEEPCPSELNLKSSMSNFRLGSPTIPDDKRANSSKNLALCNISDQFVLDGDEDSVSLGKSEEDSGDVNREECEEVSDEAKEEEETHEDKDELEEVQENVTEVKPLIVDTILDVSDEDDFRPGIDIESRDGELFYVIEEDIKSESNPFVEDDTDAMDQVEFVSIGYECKSDSNLQATDNFVYLGDSTNEQLISELDPKNYIANAITSNKSSSHRILQKRKSCTEFVCDVCGNNFTNKNSLSFHMKIHRNEKSYECEICFKRFNAACNLTAHMRIHTGEKPFECQYCGRRFADRSSHLKHERIHTNEKPYKCNVCGKAFSLSTSLKAHEKIHTGEKPYKCEPCLKSFKLPHQLKAHLNTHLHKLLSVEQ